jgi:hypothetical protein
MTQDSIDPQPAKKLGKKAPQPVLSIEPIEPTDPVTKLLRQLLSASIDDGASQTIRF